MARTAWITGLAIIALAGMLVGCNGRNAVQEPPRHSPDLSDASGMRAECPGPGYRGRLRRDLTQPYAARQYLLDDGSLCRPRP